MPTVNEISIDSLTRDEALALAQRIEAQYGRDKSASATPPADMSEAFFEAWLVEHSHLIDSLPTGTVIAIRFPAGDYITAADGLAAMDAFQKRFGTEAQGWVHHVREPVVIGGGYWQISSGA